MSDNPYSPTFQQQHQPPINASNPLMAPAIILLVIASLWLLYSILNVGFATMIGPPAPPPDAPPGFEVGQKFGFYGMLILMPLTSIIVIAGCIQMLRLKMYPLAMTAAVVSVIPFCSSCLVLGIPFGIWAIVLLLREDVKTRFS
ncbi:MAG: hypothetical protein AAFX06_17015 [Planctomycetota bacterium]